MQFYSNRLYDAMQEKDKFTMKEPKNYPPRRGIEPRSPA